MAPPTFGWCFVCDLFSLTGFGRLLQVNSSGRLRLSSAPDADYASEYNFVCIRRALFEKVLPVNGERCSLVTAALLQKVAQLICAMQLIPATLLRRKNGLLMQIEFAQSAPASEP